MTFLTTLGGSRKPRNFPGLSGCSDRKDPIPGYYGVAGCDWGVPGVKNTKKFSRSFRGIPGNPGDSGVDFT